MQPAAAACDITYTLEQGGGLHSAHQHQQQFPGTTQVAPHNQLIMQHRSGERVSRKRQARTIEENERKEDVCTGCDSVMVKLGITDIQNLSIRLLIFSKKIIIIISVVVVVVAVVVITIIIIIIIIIITIIIIIQGSTLRKNFTSPAGLVTVTFTSPEIFLLALILIIKIFK